MRLRARFDVSTEALLRRVVQVTAQPIAMFRCRTPWGAGDVQSRLFGWIAVMAIPLDERCACPLGRTCGLYGGRIHRPRQRGLDARISGGSSCRLAPIPGRSPS